MLRAIGKVLLLHHALLSLSVIDATRIVQHPQDRVLFTSSIDEDVSFVCKVELAYLGINWRVNGSVITDPSFSTTRYVDNNVYIDTLTFRARRNYNTTVVQCFANGDGYVESKSASLRYQGILAAPNNITVQNGIRSITSSWSAPFSLDVSGVDPDIWYTLLISNVTDEDHPTAVPCTDCHKLTQTHYTFNFTTDAFNFGLTIITKNGAGASPGYVVNNSGIELALATVELLGSVCSANSSVVTLWFPDAHNVCSDNFLEIYFESTESSCSSAAANHSISVSIHVEVPLDVNCTYTVIVSVVSNFGEINFTLPEPLVIELNTSMQIPDANSVVTSASRQPHQSSAFHAEPTHTPKSTDQTREHTDCATTVLLVCVPIIGVLLMTTITATVAAVIILVKYKPRTSTVVEIHAEFSETV